MDIATIDSAAARPVTVIPPMTAIHLPPTSDAAIERIRALETEIRNHPQVPIATEHVLHGGMYARTIRIPAGVICTCAVVRVPSILIANGCATVNLGDEVVTIKGELVIVAGAAGRCQLIHAIEDTHVTMLFATRAQTVEEAENEFTADSSLLGSRWVADSAVLVTGED